MKITVLQTDIAWRAPETNMADAERLMSLAKETDVFLLPEMWTTGFMTEPQAYADDNGKTLRWMKDAARRHNAAVSGSVAVKDGDRYYNRHYFCLPGGTAYAYDKRHLFGYGGETKHYERGTERVVAEYKGVRFLLLTCYDIRFPEWCRYRQDYDVVLCAASWPEQRMLAWDTLLRARAIENSCLLAAANRVGDDNQCHYIGHSQIINSYGQVMVMAEDSRVNTVSINFDIEKQNDYRRKFPVLDDIAEEY